MTESHRIITSAELAESRSREPRVAIVDVRSAADHEQGHLPDDTHNCVFEMGFEERFAEAHPDKKSPVCVYGDAADTFEARMAAEKLVRCGYEAVWELREGLEGWRRAGLPLEGGEGTKSAQADSPSLPDGVRPVDLEESRIEWTGRNLLNRHHGTIALKSGELRFQKGALSGGRFVIDMYDISCVNLAGDPMHEVLVNHLRSHDFFDTGRHPEATFEIGAVRPIADSTPGAPNLEINGTLRMKGLDNQLTFQAVSGFTPEGHFAAQATLSIDRTLWGVIYGSGKFFRNLGMHLVNDLIELRLRIRSS